MDELEVRLRRLERFNKYRWFRRAYYIASLLALLWMCHEWSLMHIALDEMRRRITENSANITGLSHQVVGLHTMVVKINGAISHTVTHNAAPSHAPLPIDGPMGGIVAGTTAIGLLMALWKFGPVLVAAI